MSILISKQLEALINILRGMNFHHYENGVDLYGVIDSVLVGTNKKNDGMLVFSIIVQRTYESGEIISGNPYSKDFSLPIEDFETVDISKFAESGIKVTSLKKGDKAATVFNISPNKK